MKILAIGFNGVPFFNTSVKAEAESRGYTMDFCSASSLITDISSERVDIRAAGLDIKTYDVIHVGAIVSNRWPLIAAMGFLQRVYGCQIVDSNIIDTMLCQYSGIGKYFLEFEHGIAFPRSIAFKKISALEDKMNEFKFPIVIKTNSSSQGAGVGLAHTIEDMQAFIDKHLGFNKNTTFVAREFIPNDGDYRVNVIGGKAVICLKRTPQTGEFRSNISLGGTLSNTDDTDVRAVCEAGEKIARLGKYDIAGVDVMVHAETGIPHILEVNRIPGSLEDDVAASGVNLAAIIVDLYEARHAA